MRDILFTPEAFEQYIAWGKIEKNIQLKINKLLLETARDPFTGTGKPETLKHDLKGYWSRRITDEHRLIYRVEDSFIKVIACKLHYS